MVVSFAKGCMMKAERDTGKIAQTGEDDKCYAAVSERFPSVRDSRWDNYDQVRQMVKDKVETIDALRAGADAAQRNFNARSATERVEADLPSRDTSRDPNCDLCANLDGCHECHICCPVYGTSRVLCYCQCHN